MFHDMSAIKTRFDGISVRPDSITFHSVDGMSYSHTYYLHRYDAKSYRIWTWFTDFIFTLPGWVYVSQMNCPAHGLETYYIWHKGSA